TWSCCPIWAAPPPRSGPRWPNCAARTRSPSAQAASRHTVSIRRHGVMDDREYIHDMATDEPAASSSKQQPLVVLGKITEILDAFSLIRPEMSLGEIQQATGLPTSTVQRLVSNMVAQGLLDRKGDRIRIGVRMSYWAATALKDLDVLAVVNPVL